MKKLFLMIVCVVFCLTKTEAQNDANLTTEKIHVSVDCERNDRNDSIMTINDVHAAVGGCVYVCANKYDRVLVYAPENCNDFVWAIGNETYNNVSPMIFNQSQTNHFSGWFYGCDYNFGFDIFFVDPNVPTETTTELWKRQHESTILDAPSGSYTYLWNTGETTATIEVTEPGTYICEVSDMCATSEQTFIVQDNVEIDLATCDLITNLNMVTWQTTPAQAQYIDHVIVKRDGLNVGTANYSDGFFLDNIGSDLAQRTYTLIAVATDGTECPIVSYPKETIHMAYLTGINNTIEVNWNIPTGYDLIGYNICEWTPDGKDGDLTVIDFVGASVTSYTCSTSQFSNNGNVVVQGVEASKTESRLLSNRSGDILSVGEQQNKIFKIYPNPSTGAFTVEGASNLTIFNTLGQVVATSYDEDGTHTFSLRSGIYFVKSGEGTVQKVIIQ